MALPGKYYGVGKCEFFQKQLHSEYTKSQLAALSHSKHIYATKWTQRVT
jgi:hypothetical protein